MTGHRDLADPDALREPVRDAGQFDKHMRTLRQDLIPDLAPEIPIDPLGLSRETAADWVFPYFIRADIKALRHQLSASCCC